MKKNKFVLALACSVSIAFLIYIYSLATNLKNSEKNLQSSPNIVDVSNIITTRLKVTSNVPSNWEKPDFDENGFKTVSIPKHKVATEPDFKPGNFILYRIHIPKSSFDKLDAIRRELYFSPQYVLLKEHDIYINGTFYRSNSAAASEEAMTMLPIDDSKDNLIAIKGLIHQGDTGINHRGGIFVGRGADLNELHRKAYKGVTVFPMVFLLCKGSILVLFTMIFLFVNVESFFEKSLLFGVFVIFEDLITGDYLSKFLNFHTQLYIFNLINIGIAVFLMLFLSDVVEKKTKKKSLVAEMSFLAIVSFIIGTDVLYKGYLFTVDHFLRFWNIILFFVLFSFVPSVYKKDKVLFSIFMIILGLMGWSAFAPMNVGYSWKPLANLTTFFMVAYQTFVLFRRQQNQLMEQEKDVAIGKTAAMLAHDVRKPLDQMSLILNRVAEGNVTAEFLEQAKKDVSFSITSVNNQINDIMSISRITQIRLEPISLYSVLYSSLTQVLSVDKGVQLKIHYDFRANIKVLGQESGLSRVFTNLISNAVEAIRDIGKKNVGNIWFSSTHRGENFIFRIENDGPPIPSEFLTEIFKPLFSHGKAHGTGIGLASVAKVIREHEGTIHVVNTSNGVAFEILLKALKVSDLSASHKFPSSNMTQEKTSRLDIKNDQFFLRLFLVDDDKYVYEYFKDLIAKTGLNMELDFFSDAELATEALIKKRYDLHFIDYDLGNGVVGTDFAKTNLSFLKSGLIIHTSRDTLELPANGRYVKKPICLTDFKQVCLETYNTSEKILLVEDSKILAIGWKMFHGNHNLEWVSSPEKAIEVLKSRSHNFGIVLTDFHFENSSMDGLDLIQFVKSSFAQLQTILVTNADVDYDVCRISKSEFDIRRLTRC